MPPRACKAGSATQWNLIHSAPHITSRPHIRSGLIHSRGRIFVRPIYSGASGPPISRTAYSAAAYTGGPYAVGPHYIVGPHLSGPPIQCTLISVRPHISGPPIQCGLICSGASYTVGASYTMGPHTVRHVVGPHTQCGLIYSAAIHSMPPCTQ